MSQSYKLLFRDHSQFIFEETSNTHSTAITTLVSGFVVGSLLGVYFASLDWVTAGSILLAIGTYVTVITSTFSLRSNPLGVVIIFITSFGTVILLTYVSRITLMYLEESRFKLVLVYAGLFAIMAEVIYLWSRLTWVEDVRLHQLILDKSGGANASKTKIVKKEASLGAFSFWIMEQVVFFLYHVYFFLLGDFKRAGEYPVLFVERWAIWNPQSDSSEKVTIVNETLKRVKICIYHWSDYCCWIPVGGIMGGMHELDRGDEISFSPHWPCDAFRIKVFAHGMIDFELAMHASVTRGHRYRFIDVAKPITLLSILSPRQSASRGDNMSHDPDESSSSSAEVNHQMDSDNMFVHIESMTKAASSNGMRRIPSSRANLYLAGSSAPSSPNDSTNSLLMKTPLASSKRKRAFKDFIALIDLSHAIAVLNESTADVKVIFYNIDDVSFMRALDCFSPTQSSSSVFHVEGPIIPKGEWKVFELSAQETLRRSLGEGGWDRKFCLRVKSLPPGASPSATTPAVELSYCTGILGDCLVVRDPIFTA